MENITVLKYSQLQDVTQYESLLKHLKPGNKFAGVEADIPQLSYTNVKYCRKLLGGLDNWKVLFELFSIIWGCDQEQFWNENVVNFYHARNYLIEQFKIIDDNEKKLAQGGTVDAGRWSMAGGDRLNSFADVVQLDQLGERYSLYPFDLGRKPYSEVFYLIALVKTVNEVNYNYNKNGHS